MIRGHRRKLTALAVVVAGGATLVVALGHESRRPVAVEAGASAAPGLPATSPPDATAPASTETSGGPATSTTTAVPVVTSTRPPTTGSPTTTTITTHPGAESTTTSSSTTTTTFSGKGGGGGSGLPPADSDFSLSCSPALTIRPGEQGEATCTVASLNGMFGSVGLTCPQGPPHSTICRFDHPNLTLQAGGSASTRTVFIVDPETAPSSGQQYPIFGGFSNPNGAKFVSHTFWQPLVVPNFNLHPCTTSGTIGAGGYTQEGNQCTLYGTGYFTGPITMSCEGLPAGATCDFGGDPVSLTPTSEHYATGSVYFMIRSTLPPGVYTFELVAEGGNVRRTSTYSLTVP